MTDRYTRGSYDRDHVGAIRKIRFVVVLLLLLAAVFVLVLGVTLVHDADMEPTYREGRPVLFLRLGGVKRGDVAVLRVDVRGTVLRRVVAVPGDTVEVSRKGPDDLVELIIETYRKGLKAGEG